MAIAPVLKTGARKGLGVRVPHPPSKSTNGKRHRQLTVAFFFLRSTCCYWPCTFGAGPSCARRDFMVLKPESLVASPLSVDAGV